MASETATKQDAHVIGVYNSIDEAERGVRELLDEGIPPQDISIVSKDFESELRVNGFITTGDVAKQGLGTGAFFGGLFGLLSGVAFLAVPGFGPLVVLGPIVSTLAGATEGALAGGLIGAVLGKIVEGKHIPKYEQQLKAGKILVIASTDKAHAERAYETLHSTASDVDTHTAA